MKKVLVVMLVLMSSVAVKAQYTKAIGIKVNHYKLAANYKFFLNDTMANCLDLELGFHETGVEFIGTYNWQVEVSGVHGLYWYYGFGANLGRWRNNAITQNSIGIDGQIGMEYNPKEIPFAFSLDYTPNYSVSRTTIDNINGASYHGAFWAENIAIGIKYVFGQGA